MTALLKQVISGPPELRRYAIEIDQKLRRALRDQQASLQEYIERGGEDTLSVLQVTTLEVSGLVNELLGTQRALWCETQDRGLFKRRTR